MLSSFKNQVIAFILATGLAGMLVACADSGEASEQRNAPEFTGPYASEFEAAFLETTSERAREILGDGEITELEYNETIEAYGSCLTGRGIEFKGFNDDFSHRFKYPDSMSYEQADQILNECATSTGEREITALYAAVSTNPDNRDIGELQVECFLAKGIVPDGYTRDDWEKDVEDRSFPIIESPTSEADLAECEEDPLTAAQE